MDIKIAPYRLNNVKFRALDKSISLAEAVDKKMLDGKSLKLSQEMVEGIKSSKELASMRIIGLLGQGASATTFETEDHKALKLTEGSHFPFARPHEDFDVPIYKQGKSGRIHYYIEEKLMLHDLNLGFVATMQDMIKAKGYRLHDLGRWDIHQIGLSSTGKLYLLDPECARFKTPFHALWKKMKSCINKQIFSRFSKALHK